MVGVVGTAGTCSRPLVRTSVQGQTLPNRLVFAVVALAIITISLAAFGLLGMRCGAHGNIPSTVNAVRAIAIVNKPMIANTGATSSE
jgi:hypothetical protein